MKNWVLTLVWICLQCYVVTAQLKFDACSSINQMYKNDQSKRNEMLTAINNNTFAAKAKVLMPVIAAIDSLNLVQLKDILKHEGMPTISKAGKKCTHEFWLLVQHMDKNVSFQEKVLEMMKNALAKQDVLKEDYAHLFDRVLVNKGLPQYYGTQRNFTNENGQLSVFKVSEASTINTRRKAYNLPPIVVK